MRGFLKRTVLSGGALLLFLACIAVLALCLDAEQARRVAAESELRAQKRQAAKWCPADGRLPKTKKKRGHRPALEE